VVVRAAEGEAAKKKAAKKRTPAPVKRAMIAEERRMYNKARKSACATRIKKVRTELTELCSVR
jgi:ribosomal protein S20